MQPEGNHINLTPQAHNLLIAKEKRCIRAYSFGFNGKLKDDEWDNVTGSKLDFGARIYDSRTGRFLSLDPLASKNPTYTPMAFADNNPILFIDHNGLYRMSKKMQKKYPQLTNVLKNIQETVHNNPKTYEAFKNTLGLTDEQAEQILQWGSGPKVKDIMFQLIFRIPLLFYIT